MSQSVQKGAPVLGVVFLVLALVRFFQGESWVVWLVLGVVFGGFGIFNLNKSGGNKA